VKVGFYYSTQQDPLIALIIDCEMHARQRLSRLLREIAPEFTGIAEARDDDEAICKIERFAPNLLFVGHPLSDRLLDELARGYAQKTPKVLLCKDSGGHENVLDVFGGKYLVKPVDAQHLRDILDVIGDLSGHGNGNYRGHNGANGYRYVPENSAYLNRLVVRRQSQFRLLPVNRVVWFGTEFRLVYAYTEKRRYPIDLGLEQLEHRLDPKIFVRIHRSAIVNVNHIKDIIPNNGGRSKILLDDPENRLLPLSASRAKQIKEFIVSQILNNHECS